MEWGRWIYNYHAEEKVLDEDRGCWERPALTPFVPKSVVLRVEPPVDTGPPSTEQVIVGWIYWVMELLGWR